MPLLLPIPTQYISQPITAAEFPIFYLIYLLQYYEIFRFFTILIMTPTITAHAVVANAFGGNEARTQIQRT